MSWVTRSIPRLIVGAGLLFLLIIGGESLYVLLVSNPLGAVWVAGLVTSVPFVLGLIYAGMRLQSSIISPERYNRVGYWCLGGLCLFVATNVIIMITLPPDSGLQLVSWGRWAATIGAGIGISVGIFEARGIERAVEAERERVRAEEAQARENLLTYLNATLRHEILNTASVIAGNADLVATRQNDDDVVDRMETIIQRTEQMENVIDDVRVLLQANKNEIDSKPVEITQMLSEEVGSLQNTYESAIVETSMPERAMVPANQALRRAFANLLRNAIEHNDSDTPRVEVTVTRESEQVVVRIADNGPGIPEEDREALFEQSIRHDSNHGIGLILTRMVITTFEGEVEVTETGCDGTTFITTLPEADGQFSDVAETTSQAAIPKGNN